MLESVNVITKPLVILLQENVFVTKVGLVLSAIKGNALRTFTVQTARHNVIVLLSRPNRK